MKQYMVRYKTGSLVDVSAEAFEQELRGMINRPIGRFWDGESNGQRDASVRFAWGHDHDFGTFKLDGKMKTRHIEIPGKFNDYFLGGLPPLIHGADVLDIGCWTGGASLMLAAMGAKSVLAVDEVGAYTKCLSCLKSAFKIDNLFIRNASLFEMNSVVDRRSFDLIYCAGVLYHLSDPIVGLRMIRNMLRPNGKLLLETAIHQTDSGMSLAEYLGPTKTGFNWWFPTVHALTQMLKDMGFDKVRRIDKDKGNRACFYATRSAVDVPIMQAGLSRNID